MTGPAESRARPGLGLLVVAASLAPYLAAANVLPSDDSDFGAPRWAVAWIVVVAFFLPGVMILGGVQPGDQGRTGRPAGLFGPLMAAVLPALLAGHSALHGFTRVGGVRVAWLALSALAAWVAYLYVRRLVRIVG